MEWPPSLLSHREHLVQPFFYIWCKASYLQTFIDQKILSGSRIKGASAGKISLVFFHFLRMVKGQELLLSLKQKQISQESKKRVRQSICHQQQRQFFCSLEWWQVFPQNSNLNLLKRQHFSWHSNIWLRNQTHEKGLLWKVVCNHLTLCQTQQFKREESDFILRLILNLPKQSWRLNHSCRILWYRVLYLPKTSLTLKSEKVTEFKL